MPFKIKDDYFLIPEEEPDSELREFLRQEDLPNTYDQYGGDVIEIEREVSHDAGNIANVLFGYLELDRYSEEVGKEVKRIKQNYGPLSSHFRGDEDVDPEEYLSGMESAVDNLEEAPLSEAGNIDDYYALLKSNELYLLLEGAHEYNRTVDRLREERGSQAFVNVQEAWNGLEGVTPEELLGQWEQEDDININYNGLREEQQRIDESLAMPLLTKKYDRDKHAPGEDLYIDVAEIDSTLDLNWLSGKPEGINLSQTEYLFGVDHGEEIPMLAYLIRDTGEGLPDDIGNPFLREETSSGGGFGTFMSKKVVELYGGDAGLLNTHDREGAGFLYAVPKYSGGLNYFPDSDEEQGGVQPWSI